MSQSLLLPAFVALFGVIAALFLRGFETTPAPRPVAGRSLAGPVEPDYFADDDEYVEYAVEWGADADEPEPEDYWAQRPAARPRAAAPPADLFAADDSVTAPFAVHVEHPLPAPADTWHGGPVETWHSLMDGEPAPGRVAGHAAVEDTTEDDPDTVPELIVVAEPLRAPEPMPARNGHAPWRSILDELLDEARREPASAPATREARATPEAPKATVSTGPRHNGFHVEHEDKLQVVSAPPVRPPSGGGRHARVEDDAGTYGRHSMPFRE
jgi:hypothetical protein